MIKLPSDNTHTSRSYCLAIDLKRFNNRFQKNQVYITFPLDNLDLSDYVIGYKKEKFKYELYGVCNQMVVSHCQR